MNMSEKMIGREAVHCFEWILPQFWMKGNEELHSHDKQ